ncbi:helix-turn-helix domain-containing protein [Rhodococcus sp. BH5]|uniref:helix-turn-helix domain-containing protein n=1 Tax=Rhodococcus sp. BH5 TaxID=2871702 RepID=UPI003FA7676D
MVWLDEWDAQRFIKRSPRTLRRWRTNKQVRAVNRGGKWFYDKDSLRQARKDAVVRQRESQLDMRNVRFCEMAGPGRGVRKAVCPVGQLVLWV